MYFKNEYRQKFVNFRDDRIFVWCILVKRMLVVIFVIGSNFKKNGFYFMGNWMEDLFVVGKENVFSLLLFLLL